MATPTIKASGIDQFLFAITGIDRIESVQNDLCVFCRKPAKDFRDPLSSKEFRISGMCQGCQDKTFGFGDDRGTED